METGKSIILKHIPNPHWKKLSTTLTSRSRGTVSKYVFKNRKYFKKSKEAMGLLCLFRLNKNRVELAFIKKYF